MKTVVHQISHLERHVVEQFSLDAKAGLNRVGVLVVGINQKDDPVWRALSGRLRGWQRIVKRSRHMPERKQARRNSSLIVRCRGESRGQYLVDIFSAIVEKR